MTTATLTFNQHEVTLEEDEGHNLFKHALNMKKTGGLLPISPDKVVLVNSNTQMSITIEDRFLELFDQALAEPSQSGFDL